MKKTFMAAILLGCAVMLPAADIFLAGDSTCASYGKRYGVLTGWGEVLQDYCKPGVKVYDHAVSGCSTKSFVEEKYWEKMIAKVKPGDYVVIQFGHNDQKKNSPKQYADVKVAYPAYLKRFIAEIRAKGGKPVLATSIVRCTFDKNGKLKDGGLRVYCEATINVATEEKVPVIDLNKISEVKINAMGEAEAIKMYMCTSGIEKRKNDRTHLQFSGAKIFAGWFADAVKEAGIPMAECFK